MHKSVTDKTLQNKLISVVSEAGTIFFPIIGSGSGSETSTCVLEIGAGEGSIQQPADNVASGIDFTGKNPNAAAYYPELDGIVEYGAAGDFAAVFGGKAYSYGKRAVAMNTTTLALANYSVSMGNSTVVGYLGVNGHAEGARTFVDGPAAHAEGQDTQSLGELSHTEGLACIVERTAKGGHAEGWGCVVRANFAHAEGYFTEAKHAYSHSSGYYTVTGRDFQYVCGAYNEGKTNTIFEVGNGNATKRTNAFEVRDDNSIGIEYKKVMSTLQDILLDIERRVVRAEDRLNNTEIWEFTTEGGEIITKRVVIGAEE